MRTVEPGKVKLPAGVTIMSLMLLVGQTLPPGHNVHVLDALLEMKPLGQPMHVVDPAVLYVPLPQSAGVTVPFDAQL